MEFEGSCSTKRVSQVALVVKNLPANAGDTRDAVLIPESGRSPGRRHGNSLQYSSLETPLDRRVWRSTVHRVTKSQTQLKRLCMHAHTPLKISNFYLHLGLRYYLWYRRKHIESLWNRNIGNQTAYQDSTLDAILIGWEGRGTGIIMRD